MSFKATKYQKIAAGFILLGCLILISFSVNDSNKEDYSRNLKNKGVNKTLEGTPLMFKYGKATCVKVAYKIDSKELFFINSNRYKFHFGFCEKVGGWTKGIDLFNELTYHENANQPYILANLNYFESIDKYVLEFTTLNQISKKQISFLYHQVAANSFFGEELLLLKNCESINVLASSDKSVNYIGSTDLFLGQKFQPVNKTKSYGFLRKIATKDLKNETLNQFDILLTDGSPIETPSVSGLITGELQSPLSHLVLLGINRKIPICAFTNAWDDPAIDQYLNKPVQLTVE